jgi:hypothetical protein
MPVLKLKKKLQLPILPSLMKPALESTAGEAKAGALKQQKRKKVKLVRKKDQHP